MFRSGDNKEAARERKHGCSVRCPQRLAGGQRPITYLKSPLRTADAIVHSCGEANRLPSKASRFI